MEERICSNCDGGVMKFETGDIQREIKVSFVKLSVEEYLPEILKGYSQYTLYVCENCGKLEVFLKKAKKMIASKRRASRLLDQSSIRHKRSN
jgi:DNA-directed RNA polymerase subunit RPC12/RpoP